MDQDTLPPRSSRLPLLREAAAAELLGLKVRTLQKDRLCGSLGVPFIRVGAKAVRYDPTDLERWLDERRCVGGEVVA